MEEHMKTMSFLKKDSERELVCISCNAFFSRHQLKDGKCPVCLEDDNVFLNNSNEELNLLYEKYGKTNRS